VFYYSPTREGKYAEQQLAAYTGICQADAYSGFNGLFEAGREPGPIIEAACWAHSRRKFSHDPCQGEIHKASVSPLARRS
jgi:transposase